MKTAVFSSTLFRSHSKAKNSTIRAHTLLSCYNLAITFLFLHTQTKSKQMNNIYPENFELKIGFTKIRALLKEICLSNLGKELVDDMRFMRKKGQLEWELSLTDEFAKLLRETNGFPINFYFDMRAPLTELRTEGRFLDAEKLFNLKRSLETIIAILRFAKQLQEEAYPRMLQLVSQVESYPFVKDKIERILDSNGKVKDSASPELAQIRRDLFSKQSNVSKRLHAILRQAQKEGFVDADTSLSIRDGRPVIPIAAAKKRQIRGIVHDESATGKTAYIEPAEVVEMNNQIRELEYAEKREIVRILVNFANEIRPNLDELIAQYDFLASIDFIRAKAILGNKMESIKPVMKWEPHLEWYNATHPLLRFNLEKEKRNIVPLNIKLTEENHILLISGPNAGGKSVCLKTVGLLQYMLQCGLMIPLLESSVAGFFENIFIDIGDEQSIDNDLSTYSSHLMNMKHFIRYGNSSTLVLIDEFGTGTEPMLGGAIAEAILTKLNEMETFGVITTHYTNLKHFASSTDGIVNGAMLYDTHKLEPLFELKIGGPGSSFAFEIARKIGMPESVLQDATEKIGQDHIDFDKNLRQILRDKRYWESKRQKIRQVEKSLENTTSKYESELSKLNEQRKKIIDDAKAEAALVIEAANKKVEHTIQEIREKQAEKDKTKSLRQDLNRFKKSIQEENNEQSDWINRKMEKIKQKQNKRRSKEEKETENKAKAANIKIKTLKAVLKVGANVKIAGQTAVGEIIELGEKNAVIALGLLRTTVPIKKLTAVSNNEAKRENKQYNSTSANVSRDLHQKRLKFKPDIDIRGQRVEEAITNIQSFIDEALMLGVGEVRILHGKGSGILKETIRNYMKADHAIESYRDEHVDFGGAGITVVSLG
ncbi:MAG: endonuclease MutS2 [Mangrovibacterium sp.]